jgi:hypothetical protein
MRWRPAAKPKSRLLSTQQFFTDLMQELCVSSDSMREIVSLSVPPRLIWLPESGAIALVGVDGELTVEKLRCRCGAQKMLFAGWIANRKPWRRIIFGST